MTKAPAVEIIDTMEHMLDISKADAFACGTAKDSLRYRLTATSMALQYLCATAIEPYKTLDVMIDEMRSPRGIEFMQAVIKTPAKELK